MKVFRYLKKCIYNSDKCLIFARIKTNFHQIMDDYHSCKLKILTWLAGV